MDEVRHLKIFFSFAVATVNRHLNAFRKLSYDLPNPPASIVAKGFFGHDITPVEAEHLRLGLFINFGGCSIFD